MGIQVSTSVGMAADIGMITDNTGVVSDDVLENIAATTSPADVAPTSTSPANADPTSTALSCGSVGCDSTHPSKASVDTALSTLQTRINALTTKISVDTALSTLQTRINALSTKATVDARIQSLENNCSDLAAAVNDLRTNLRAVRLMR